MNNQGDEFVDPYRVFFEHSLDALLLATPEGEILRANRAACEMFNCTEQDLRRLGRKGIVEASDARMAVALKERSHSGKIRTELTFVRQDETKFEGDLTSVLSEGPDGKTQANIIIRDVTPYLRTLQALRNSESKMKSIFLAAPVGIGMVANRVFTEVNSKFCEITGYSSNELLGQSARIIYPTDEEYEYVGRVKYDLIKKHGTGYVETRFRRKDGKIVHILMSSTPLDPNDLSTGVTFTAMDITERKWAEEALFESEKRFRNLAEMLPETVFESDPNLNLTFFNRQAYKMFGYSIEDFEKGLNGYDLIVPEERERARANAGKRLQGDTLGLKEYNGLRKDGTIFPFLLNTHPIITGGNITGFRGIIIDVTENKKLEKQLRRAQKMESVGRLAGGVAHDYNNMLGVIVGNTELALDLIEESDALFNNLMEIKKAADRSAALTQQLLAFAQKQHTSPKIMNLNKAIEEMASLLRGILTGCKIQYDWIPDLDLWRVKADPSQIAQILSSLFMNARDAGSNHIVVETKNMVVDQLFCSEHPGIIPGEYAQIIVADNGSGIDQQARDQVFEPFYTTKRISEGAGLGLSTAYGIVKQNNGFIYIDGEKGRGTTVRIFLPHNSHETGS